MLINAFTRRRNCTVAPISFASNQGRLRLPGARKTRPQFCVSLPILSFQMVTSVRCVEVLVGTQRHDAGGVNVIVGDVIVSLNVIKVHRR